MVNDRFEINGISYPLVSEVPLSLNFQQADIREPDKRNSSFSKTIQLYGTNEINKLFENIFEYNVVTNLFNVNKTTECKYFYDELMVFNGSLQLVSVSKTKDFNIIYNCTIRGNEGNLFIDIGDAYLEDLDFSEYDHAYTRDKIIDSWSNLCDVNTTPTTLSNGSGYLYGFIQRGFTSSETVFNVSDFLPQLYAREYIKKILESKGYTLNTSAILDSDEFKSIIVEPNISTVALTSAQLDNMQFYVGLTANQAITIGTPTFINFTDESAPFFDLGAQVFGTYAALNSPNYYNIVSDVKYRIKYTHTDTNVAYIQPPANTVELQLQKSGNGGASYFVLNYVQLYLNNTTTNVFTNDVFMSDSIAVASGSQLFGADYFKVKIRPSENAGSISYFNSSMVPITPTGTLTKTFEVISGTSGSSFYCLATQKQAVEDNTIYMNSALPKKIKQKDFMKSIMQTYNLYIDTNKTDPKILTIESYPEYFGNGITNWENKIDLNKEVLTNPVSLLDGKRYIFKYKSDKDFYNKKYEDNWNEPFGTERKEIDNDFIKSEKINELIFSPTPNIANYSLGIAVPKIYKEDPFINGVKSVTPNIRLLYYGGIKQATNSYTFKKAGDTDLITTNYAYVGHVDDPQTPTMDLNFGTPKEVYYSFVGSGFTNNNSYNRFHKPFIENITNRDSKVIIAYLWLTPQDIANFSFRRKYFIDGAYYLVNKIIDYNPKVIQSTKCELIKVLNIDVFAPSNFLFRDMPNIPAGLDSGFQTDNSSLRLGQSINLGKNCIAIGDGNFIPASAENVTVIGNNVVIAESVSNVSVTNTNDVTITESNVNYLNGILTSQWNSLYSAFLKITASGGGAVSMNLDETHSTLIADAQANTIDYYLPNPSTVYTSDINGFGMSKIYTFVRINSTANNVTINPYASETINGASYKTLTTQWQTLRVQTDGTNWYIID